MLPPRTAALTALLAAGCATAPYDRAWVGTAVSARTGHTLGPASAEGRRELPERVSIGDGLDAGEAVAVALWRSPALQAELTTLDSALADFDEARRPANPRLNFLAPIDPRQLALILLVPIDALWQVPFRTEAAGRELERVAESMVQLTLDLERDVRGAHADAVLARARVEVRDRIAATWGEAVKLADSRATSGDGAPAEADAVHAEQTIAEDAVRRAERDVEAADARLLALLGAPWPKLPALVSKPPELRALPGLEALIAMALKERAELRAAELAIHAAAVRARWERSRVVSFLVTVDGQAPVGQLGPNWSVGLQADLPVFSQNQGGIGRADAAVLRAVHRYAATRLAVALEVVAAHAALERARASSTAYDRVLSALDATAAAMRRAYEHGAESYLVVVDATRRAADARLRRVELDAETARAEADLARAVGGRVFLEAR